MQKNNHTENQLFLLAAGSLLRKRREAAQLTLADVSRRSRVTIAHLSRIENGLTDPRLSTLSRVLDAMGGTLSDVDAPRVVTVPVQTVLERRVAGQTRVDRAGLGSSDPHARLVRKDRAGVDVSDERSGMRSL